MSMSNVAVVNAVSTLLAANASRKGVMVQSVAANTTKAYLKWDSSATALTSSNGIEIAPGQLIIISAGMGGYGTDFQYAVQAIAADATTVNMRVVEIP